MTTAFNSKTKKDASTEKAEPLFLSGIGQYFSCNPKSKKPALKYGAVSYQNIIDMAANPQAVNKDKAKWSIFSDYIGDPLARSAAVQKDKGNYHALWADIDEQPDKRVIHLDELKDAIKGFVGDSDHLIYSSRGATSELRKWRAIIPLTESCCAVTYKRLANLLNEHLKDKGITPDPANESHVQICYLPNKGQHYEHYKKDGDFLNWKDKHSAKLLDMVEQEREKEEARKTKQELKRQEKAKELEQGVISPIDAYQSAYDIRSSLLNYGYTKTGNKWLSPNSSSNVAGLKIIESGLKYVTSHQSDISAGLPKRGDSFDLFKFYEHNNVHKDALRAAAALFTVNGKTLEKANQIAHMKEKERLEKEVGNVLTINPATFDDTATASPTLESIVSQTSGGVKSGFSLIDINDIELREPDWLICDYFEKDSLSCLFGDPAGGKSFVAIDMALSVANGVPWAGHNTQQGVVLYIAGEGHNGLKKRVSAWEQHNNIDKTPAGNLFFSNTAALLANKESAQEVAREIQRIVEAAGKQPSFIVVDTLARNMGADENSTKDMNDFIDHLDAYLKVPYKACVMIVHHTGHADKSRARGAMSLKGALDAEYRVVQGNDKKVSVECTKMKEFEEAPMKTFKFVTTQVEFERDGKTIEVKSAVLELTANNDEAKKVNDNAMKAYCVLLDLYKEYGERIKKSGRNPDEAKVTLDDWKDAFKKKHYPDSLKPEAGKKEKDRARKGWDRVKTVLSEADYIKIENNHVIPNDKSAINLFC